MKKLILILLVTLIGIISCVKNEIIYNPWEVSKSFQDICKYDENTTYYMSCNINPKEVEVYFSKKTYVLLWVQHVVFQDMVYHVNRDTVYIDREDYRYTPDEFRNVLISKNKLQRDTTLFKFTPNMYCTWETFDKIYNTYIKE
jgi:hypothetical protein